MTAINCQNHATPTGLQWFQNIEAELLTSGIYAPQAAQARLSEAGQSHERICDIRACQNTCKIISGPMVEYIVAIDVTRVRFPADAIAWPRRGTAQLGRGQGHMAAKLTTCTGEQYVSSAPCSSSAFAVLLCFGQAYMQHSAPSARTA